MIVREDFEEIVDTFEQAGYETRPYKGQYGKSCLAIICQKPMKALLHILAHVDRHDSMHVSTMIALLGDPETDAFGLQQVLYFPSVQWLDDEEENQPVS